MQLLNSKILVTGATGQLAHSIVCKLAVDNTVHAIARFGAPGSMDKLEAVGVTCTRLDYTSDDLNRLDDNYDYILHFATYQVPGSKGFEEAIRVNAVGTGKLMYYFRKVKAFFFCSTCSVYQPQGEYKLKETDPLGDSMLGQVPHVRFLKVAAEAVVKFTSEQFGVPAIIARMNVSYGPNGGLRSEEQHPQDMLIDPEWVRRRSRDYLGEADSKSPLASAVYSDLSGFPPLFISAGEHDILREEAEKLAANALTAGVICELDIGAGMIHGWHGLFESEIPETVSAWQRVGVFCNKYL